MALGKVKKMRLFVVVVLFCLFSFNVSALTFKTGETISPKNASTREESAVSPSFFVPYDIWQSYDNASHEMRAEICGYTEGYSTALDLVPTPIPKRIKGLNSRMDNFRSVEGFVELDEFVRRLPKFVARAHANGAENHLSSALAALDMVAEAQGWVDTKSCTKDGYYSECERAWKQKDGQDLAESMDFSAAQVRIMHLYYMYKALLNADFRDDVRLKKIDEWFEIFIQRNKRVNEVFFGLDLGWHWPAFAALYEADKQEAAALASKMVKEIDMLVLDDGSLKDRTTRGNRALWYHYEAIGETFISIEIARNLGVEIPTELEEKLLKSVEIFINGFEDPSTLDKWASKAHNSIYKTGEQKFNNTLASLKWANSWFYIFQYRYPQHPASNKLKSYLKRARDPLVTDGMVGLGLGCIYEVANQNR